MIMLRPYISMLLVKSNSNILHELSDAPPSTFQLHQIAIDDLDFFEVRIDSKLNVFILLIFGDDFVHVLLSNSPVSTNINVFL